MNVSRLNSAQAVLLLAVSCVAGSAQPADDLAMPLERLKQGLLSEADATALERHRSDPRTVLALKAAFDRGAPKQDMQRVAITLIHLGEKSDVYFGFLASFVKEALADRAPSWIPYDADGNQVNGRFSGAFEIWCTQNGKDPKATAELQFSHGFDVWMLARARDQRAVPLFIEGLDSPNPFVVGRSVGGLGRLQVTSALPRIEQVLEHLPSGARLGIAMDLPWYSSPEAYRLMERFVPSAPLRNLMRNTVAQDQMIEIEAQGPSRVPPVKK